MAGAAGEGNGSATVQCGGAVGSLMQETKPSKSPSLPNGLLRKVQRLRKSKGALLLLVFTVFLAALGFVREAVFAYFFGTSAELDAFLIALTLPKLLAMQVTTVSVSVLLPVYVGRLELDDPAGATTLVRAWMVALGGILVGACLVLGIFPRSAVSLLAPGLSADQKAMAAYWIRQLLPYLLMLGLAGALKVVLDSHKKYSYPAGGRVIVAMSTIAVCLFGANKYGVGALPFGFVAGAAGSFGLQWWQARKVTPKLGSIRVRFEELLNLPWAALGWVFLQTVTGQLFTVFDRGFASLLPAGNISAINYANAAMAAPLSMSTAVLATVLFPVMAAMAARQEWRRAFSMTMKWVGIIVLGGGVGAVGLTIFRVEFIDLLFGRGAFDEEAIAVTSSIVGVLSFTLLTAGCSPLLNRLLLSFRLFRTVAVLAIGITALKLLLNYLLIGSYGVVGLAIASVVAGSVGVLIRIGIASYVVRNRTQQ